MNLIDRPGHNKTHPTTVALQEVLNLVRATPIYGFREDYNNKTDEEKIKSAMLFSGGLDFRWEQGFGVEASISLKFNVDFDAKIKKGGDPIGTYTVLVGHSGANRDVVTMAAFTKLVTQVSELATLMQYRLDHLGPFTFTRPE